MKKVLVIGGAGYIGSHMVKLLLESGCDVLTLDNLSSGHRDAVLGGEFIEGDIEDTDLMEGIFTSASVDAVMHFASYIQVGESMAVPEKYYRNNLVNTLNLVNAMRKHGIKHFIFSSTAAIFGEPHYIPIDEKHPKAPISPYGSSKLMVEQILEDFSRAYDFRYASLRYFNAAGADPGGKLGEMHDPETHLIPIVLQVAGGKRDYLEVFGDDFDTPDGTCVRDYIHVSDLCDAHLLALRQLWTGEPSGVYNLGNGQGFSVREVVDTARRVTGKEIPVRIAGRRTGDPARLVADSRHAREGLGWCPRYATLDTIIEHAWRWQSAHK